MQDDLRARRQISARSDTEGNHGAYLIPQARWKLLQNQLLVVLRLDAKQEVEVLLDTLGERGAGIDLPGHSAMLALVRACRDAQVV